MKKQTQRATVEMTLSVATMQSLNALVTDGLYPSASAAVDAAVLLLRKKSAKADPLHPVNTRTRALGLPSTLTIREWKETVRHFNHRCAYCQLNPRRQVEHFVPVSQGGGSTAGNCLPCCIKCNQIKRTRTAEECVAIFGEERIAMLASYLASRSAGPNVGAPPSVALGVAGIKNLCESVRQVLSSTPQTAKDIGKKLGIRWFGISSVLSHGVARGWAERVGEGLYVASQPSVELRHRSCG